MEKLIYCFQKYKLIIIAIGIALLVITAAIFYGQLENENDNRDNNVILYDDNEMKTQSENIKVNIKGAVANPGVYELVTGSRVEDAIKSAGGLRNDADTSIINLSKRLNDESVVIIYTKEEVKQIKKGNTVIQYIEKECNCPSYENEVCIDPDSLVNSDNDTSDNNANKISINKATLSELQTLPGIGKTKAQAIIDYRNQNGLFITITDLKKVSGIGNSTFEKIKEYITL